MDRMSWIKDLVLAEQEMELKGLVDISFNNDSEKNLEQQSHEFLHELRAKFSDAINAFNQFKESPHGQIKIYGISKTIADFMLFRNGYKLIFSLKNPGLINITSSQMASVYIPGAADPTNFEGIHHSLQANWGPFEELIWTYKDRPVIIENLVRYYLKAFARNSVK